jgi:hypothetical protein
MTQTVRGSVQAFTRTFWQFFPFSIQVSALPPTDRRAPPHRQTSAVTDRCDRPPNSTRPCPWASPIHPSQEAKLLIELESFNSEDELLQVGGGADRGRAGLGRGGGRNSPMACRVAWLWQYRPDLQVHTVDFSNVVSVKVDDEDLDQMLLKDFVTRRPQVRSIP